MECCCQAVMKKKTTKLAMTARRTMWSAPPAERLPQKPISGLSRTLITGTFARMIQHIGSRCAGPKGRQANPRHAPPAASAHSAVSTSAVRPLQQCLVQNSSSSSPVKRSSLRNPPMHKCGRVSLLKPPSRGRFGKN